MSVSARRRWMLAGALSACGPTAPETPTDPQTSSGPQATGDPATTSPATSSPTSGLTGEGTAGASTSGVTPDPTTSGTTGTSTASTDLTTDGEDSGRIPCNELHLPFLKLPRMVIVLNKSGSMSVLPGWDHDGDPNTPTVTRWQSLHEEVAAMLAAHGDQFELGVGLLPSVDAKEIYNIEAYPVNDPIEVPLAPMNGPAILAGIPAADDLSLQGAEPTAAAVAAAVAQLSVEDAPPRHVLLVTDGPANCRAGAPDEMQRFEVYDDNLHFLVADAKAAGIVTHVVGIATEDEVTGDEMDGEPDGVNPSKKLGELAVLGGRPNQNFADPFHHADDQQGLADAFAAIVADAQRCVVPLPLEPSIPDFTRVLVGDTEISKVPDCSGGDGWMFTDPDGPFDEIELCGAACEALKAAGAVDVNYFCFSE